MFVQRFLFDRTAACVPVAKTTRRCVLARCCAAYCCVVAVILLERLMRCGGDACLGWFLISPPIGPCCFKLFLLAMLADYAVEPVGGRLCSPGGLLYLHSPCGPPLAMHGRSRRLQPLETRLPSNYARNYHAMGLHHGTLPGCDINTTKS